MRLKALKLNTGSVLMVWRLFRCNSGFRFEGSAAVVFIVWNPARDFPRGWNTPETYP